MNHMKQISWILMPALLKYECEQCSEYDQQSFCSEASSPLLVYRLKSLFWPPELNALNYAFERNFIQMIICWLRATGMVRVCTS